MVPSPFFYTVVAGLSTGLGGVLAAAVRPSRQALDACMGFAGGVMLAISLADLAPAAIGFYGSYLTPAGTAVAVALLLGLGALLAWGLLQNFLTPGLLNGTVALVAGVMLWVALAELLPQALRAGLAGAAGACAGCLGMLFSIAVLR